jgi:hypothetical protein
VGASLCLEFSCDLRKVFETHGNRPKGLGVDQAGRHDQHRVGVHRGLRVVALIEALPPERGMMRDSGSVRLT